MVGSLKQKTDKHMDGLNTTKQETKDKYMNQNIKKCDKSVSLQEKHRLAPPGMGKGDQ